MKKVMRAYRLDRQTLEQLNEMAADSTNTEVLTQAISEKYRRYQKEQMMSKFYEVSAGSGYGRRDALYQVVEGVFVLRHEGAHDNLAGNDVACDFEGLTLEQAQEKARAITNEPVAHEYDGCHACGFGVTVRPVEPPDWYTYEDPPDAEIIRQALANFYSPEDFWR